MTEQPNGLNSSHARKRKGRGEGSMDRPLGVVEKSNEGEPPNQKFKGNSIGSSVQSRKGTALSQTISSASVKSRAGKDGLLHKVKSERVASVASRDLFAPDKVRVRKDKTTGSGSEVKVKMETMPHSQRLMDANHVESVKIKKEESPKKKATVVSSTLSTEQVNIRSDGKAIDKVVSQPRPGVLESDDEDSDDVPLTCVSGRKMETLEPTPKQVKKEPNSEEDDDLPLAKKITSTDLGKEIKSEKHQSTKSSVPKEKKSSSKKTDSSKSSESRKRPKSGENDSDMKLKGALPAKKIKSELDEEDFKDCKPAKKSKAKKVVATKSPEKRGKRVKKEEPAEVWKWWEEAPLPEGVRWLTLEHKGPYFAPPYTVLPSHVHFRYSGNPHKLSQDAEEVAGFFAKMLDHEYTSKDVFKKNFWEDWRKAMTSQERKEITDFDKCDFTLINEYYKQLSEEKKQMSKEEKQKIKEDNEKLQQEYGFCVIDGHREKIGNWKIEPPGLFRGRGDHPKMGKLKKRTQPEDVTINIGKEAAVPVPPAGRKWKHVQHDNKDFERLACTRYNADALDAVALYFIDILALRAGNEKDTDEEADTVGCCSLRVEHITLHDSLDGQECVVEFDFLGKDSVRYYNRISVESRVYKNLKHFMKNKEPGDDLFDRLSTSELNKHLQELMPGLTAKVFRTYNASITLQNQLEELTNAADSIPELMLSYNRANRQVAILCNHQRAVPKTFEKSMANLKGKIDEKLEKLAEAQKELKQTKKEAKGSASSKAESTVEKKKAAVKRVEEQLRKLEVAQTDKEENKTIALGTSKLNYLDPRISVAWCKKHGVTIEKVYNKTQRDKFNWAIDMADETFVF